MIADVRLALSRGGSLLALNHSEQWTAPSILIAKFPDDRSLVRQGMKQGALDFIAKPVNRGEAVAAITVALWLNELKIQVAYRKETLVGLRSEHAVLSVAIDARVQTRSLNEKILSTEEVLRSCEKTMEAVENSLSFLTRTAEGLEQKTRERAFHRLPNS